MSKEFKEFIGNTGSISPIVELAMLGAIYSDMSLNESELSDELLESKFHNIVKKTGLHLSKNKGLIDYFISAGKGIGMMIAAAIQGDSVKIKEIAKTVKKEDLIDVLLKLDQATMHFVTGPIHLIDAITGWHIGAAVGKATETTITQITKAVKTAKEIISDKVQNTKLKNKMLSNIVRLEKLIPVGIN